MADKRGTTTPSSPIKVPKHGGGRGPKTEKCPRGKGKKISLEETGIPKSGENKNPQMVECASITGWKKEKRQTHLQDKPKETKGEKG